MSRLSGFAVYARTTKWGLLCVHLAQYEQRTRPYKVTGCARVRPPALRPPGAGASEPASAARVPLLCRAATLCENTISDNAQPSGDETMADAIPLPLRERGITRDRLATLILAYAETGDIEEAASTARMSLRDAVAALRTDGARQMMARALRVVLDMQAAPEALAVLRASLRDPSARIRTDAAKSLLDRAGMVAAPADAARERNLSELSADDLAALIDQLRQEESERRNAPPQEPDFME